ncbi:histone-lysine N-methyltransferase family member SUVH9-like [Heracleum sosnowskyi]|uniref:Histone-lysine N-methyltransferase family member SUVH9-like n=1 Tax=Heracleum sosnowskyi TaxID=360622 RepID=A0AAD8J2Y3_9APIA|nr:histone-lysine N-methyltransferase family member SUVH9-like [Heracleum sosnowskyi]
MASFTPFPDPTPAVTGATSTLPAATIQPKPEPVDEDSLIAPPGMPTPPGIAAAPPGMPIPLAVEFPQTATPRESRPGTSADGANVYPEYNRVADEMFNNVYFFPGYLHELGLNPGNNNDARDIVPVADNPGNNNDARDIVPVAENPGNQILLLDQGQHGARSNELVRVINLNRDDQAYYRDILRKTRMIFDAIRIYSTADEEKKIACGFDRRSRGDLKAATVMRNCGLCLFTDKRIVGALPGVEIGDVFSYRVEMSVVGLHKHPQAGIDFLAACRSSNWEPIATSIVVSGGYEGNDDRQDVIIYSGHGGLDKRFRQVAHQNLEGGNRALERSMYYGIEVRVIRGHEHDGSPSGRLYVYDGLYKVVDFWPDMSMSGYRVYKYKVVRLPDQPKLGSVDLWLARSLRTTPLARLGGYVCLDISMGQEKFPVTLFNTIDYDHEPLEHEYLVKSIMPSYVHNTGNSGCDCLYKCSRDCLCAKKNGGEFAYDDKEMLIQGKPLIFECGPFCSCPPNCRNRVTQRGVRHRLEVFRSTTGWGVRPLDYIQAGSFLCEYAGVVLTREQAQVVSMGGDNLVYPKRFTERWAEWGDLSQVSPNYVRPSHPEIAPLDYAMDVSGLRNVASYISHSRSPNVMVQFVLHDHTNAMFPRLMLFATETIPPFREFTLDYGGVADELSPKLAICN